jgi:hypothetical protein
MTVVPELIGLIGTIVAFAGIHLLWQSRKELVYWIETYLKLFRASLQQPGTPLPRAAVAMNRHQREHTLRLLLGCGLLFLLGPALIVLGLTL